MNNAGNWAWFDENALISGHDGDYNMPVFRFAEVLLIAAEGLARTNHEDNAVGGAKYYLNQVRKRAGLADETATGNDLIQSILTERLHELPLEFKIWDDIRRTRLYPEASTESGKLKWTALASAQIQNKPDGSTRAGAIPEYALLWPSVVLSLYTHKYYVLILSCLTCTLVDTRFLWLTILLFFLILAYQRTDNC